MISVLGDRVLVAVRPAPHEVTTASGLVLVKDPDAARTPTQGIVMALGEKTDTIALDDVIDLIVSTHANTPGLINWHEYLPFLLKKCGSAPFDVEIGDCVIFPLSAGDAIHQDGVDYVILREADIIGIVQPLASEAAA